MAESIFWHKGVGQRFNLEDAGLGPVKAVEVGRIVVCRHGPSGGGAPSMGDYVAAAKVI